MEGMGKECSRKGEGDKNTRRKRTKEDRRSGDVKELVACSVPVGFCR
jgi:hypothetical protein